MLKSFAADTTRDPFNIEPLTEKEEKHYCRVYIQEYRRLGGRGSDVVEESHVEIMFALLKAFQVVKST